MINGYRLITRQPLKVDAHLERFPALSFHEVIDREITRVIEIWVDGHTGIARSNDMLELGGSCVPENLDPEPEPEISSPVTQITREQFERFWTNAVRRVEWELGTKVPG